MKKTASRRNFLAYIPGTLLGVWAASGVKAFSGTLLHTDPAGSASSDWNEQSGQSGPTQPPLPPALQGQGPDSAGPRVELRHDPKGDDRDIRVQIRRLAELADQLKQQVEKTDSTKVLSVDLLRKTQDIEKLAHHIAALARG